MNIPAIPPKEVSERHYIHRVGWLRAAVLGANDGIVSTASLIIGVAAANATNETIFLAGVAGLVAGAMSMAAGEYVSVSSQADTERADLAREREELKSNFGFELDELTKIYVKRGLDHELAQKVAKELMKHDAIGAHARDELGISESITAKPTQAALASAATFSLGASLPLFMATISPNNAIIPFVCVASLVSLALLGSLSARTGGANPIMATIRVVFWGAFAMLLTAGIGTVFHVNP